MSEHVPITINVPEEQAERLARAIERAGCVDVIECIAEEYRKRIRDAFVRHCPERPYTGSPLDVDTLMAYLEHRLAHPPRDRRAEDRKGGPDGVPGL